MLWFMVASRSFVVRDIVSRKELTQIQKEFLGDCYAENRWYLASERNKIQRKQKSSHSS